MKVIKWTQFVENGGEKNEDFYKSIAMIVI